MQVEEFLEQSARRFPEKTALVCEGQRLSYRTVEEQSNRLAHALIAAGVRRGDRVAIYLPNSVAAVLGIFAALKAGAVFLPINPSTKEDKLTYLLNNSRSRVLLTEERKARSAEAPWQNTPHLETIITVGTDADGSAAPGKPAFAALSHLLAQHAEATTPPEKQCIDVDLAALIYTSGSTGNAKGVMLTHLNMVTAATSITTYLENTPEDIILDTLPISFDYGLYQILMGFKVGGTVILERSFTYPHAVLQKIPQERVTGFPIVPTLLAMLLQMGLSSYDLSSLRYITSTSAALPAAHIQKLHSLLPQTQIYSMYGLTECKRVSYLPPSQLDRRPNSVGRGMPNEEVYIVDDAGNRLGPRQVGELVVRGSHVMRGYWELPEETDRALRPGPLPGERVLYTGDLFWKDEEGYLFFVGRRDDMLKSRGEKVSPREVEEVLCHLEGVAEAAVIGVPDPVLGQAIKAVVVAQPNVCLTAQDVLRHCAQHLEDFMVPKLVEFRDALPKNPNGKTDKHLLAQAST